MSDHSKIEWTDASWPVTVGCDHVSEGCDGCYAATLASGRLKHLTEYAGLAAHGRFNGTVRCLPERLDWPLKWRKPRRIFVCSMSDLFHESVPDEFIASVFTVMAKARQHTFQVLTKRHGRMRSLLSSPEFQLKCFAAATARGWDMNGTPWPLPNVWVGVSAESQHWAAVRVHALLATPAAVRWVSAEPLLGPVDLRNLQVRGNTFIDALCGDVKTGSGEIYAACPGSVSWVVAGGESGAKARPMHPDWARSLRDQCQAASVPFLFKQWGAYLPVPVVDDPKFAGGRAFDHPKGGRAAAVIKEAGGSFRPGLTRPMRAGDHNGHGIMLDESTLAVRTGKGRAGRVLDGRTWNEFPCPAETGGAT